MAHAAPAGFGAGAALRQGGQKVRAKATAKLQEIHAAAAGKNEGTAWMRGHIADTTDMYKEADDAHTQQAVVVVSNELAAMVAAQARYASTALPTAALLIKQWQQRYAKAGGAGGFDWVRLGSDALPFFASTPRGLPLAGIVRDDAAWTSSRKARATAADGGVAGMGASKGVSIKERRAQAKEVINADGVTAAESEYAKQRMEVMAKHLRSLMASPHAQELDVYSKTADGRLGPVTRRTVLNFVRVLLDPGSYTQTVENIFYFSFIVSQDLAAVLWGKEPSTGTEMPFIAMVNKATAEADAAAAKAKGAKTAPKQQFALQIDQNSWEKLREDLGITKPLIPHRKTADSLVLDKTSKFYNAGFVFDSADAKAAEAAAAAAAKEAAATAAGEGASGAGVGGRRGRAGAGAAAAAAADGDDGDEDEGGGNAGIDPDDTSEEEDRPSTQAGRKRKQRS